MRVHVLHDARGNIQSFGIALTGENQLAATLQPHDGLTSTAIDVPQLDASNVGQHSRKALEFLAAIKRSQRVDVNAAQGRLVAKKPTERST